MEQRKGFTDMAEGSIRVSQSKVKTYRRCHYAYFLKYVKHLRRRQIKRPFQFGRIVHKMVEAEANADDPFEVLNKVSLDNQKLFTAEKEMYGEIIEDIRTIMTAYFDYYRDEKLIYYRKARRSAEHELTITIADNIDLICIIDAIARTPNNLRWIVERKTFSKAVNEDERWRNLQACIYIKALEIAGWPAVDGMCWDYIKSKPPTVPQLLKSGKLSKKRLDSLPSVVRATIKKHNLKITDYQSLIQSTEANLKNYFYRVYTPVHENIVERVWEDFIATAKEIRDTHGTKKDKNIERHCSWCDFESICRAEMQNLDVDMIIRREYEDYKKEEESRQKSKTQGKVKCSKQTYNKVTGKKA
jgi:hypothetical protein